MEMSWLEISYFVVAVLIMLIGLLGTILPVIPGTPVILITGWDIKQEEAANF